MAMEICWTRHDLKRWSESPSLSRRPNSLRKSFSRLIAFSFLCLFAANNETYCTNILNLFITEFDRGMACHRKSWCWLDAVNKLVVSNMQRAVYAALHRTYWGLSCGRNPQHTKERRWNIYKNIWFSWWRQRFVAQCGVKEQFLENRSKTRF